MRLFISIPKIDGSDRYDVDALNPLAHTTIHTLLVTGRISSEDAHLANLRTAAIVAGKYIYDARGFRFADSDLNQQR